MSASDSPLGLYLHLALASERKLQMLDRDKLLVLAGVYAAAAGIHPVAALCRHKVLEHNRHHLIGHWPTVASALEDEDFHMFLKQLDRRYPREKAELLLEELGIDPANERDTYLNEYEYAAALLGATPDELDERFDAEQIASPAADEPAHHTTQPEVLAQPDAALMANPVLWLAGLCLAVGGAAGYIVAYLIYR